MSKAIYVYLAGPITGCNIGEANDWRDELSEMLASEGPYVGVSPLRCEPLQGEIYTPDYPDPRFGTPTAIQMKNYLDVQKADVVVAYIPKALGKPSPGTVCELSWAFCHNKPRILISDLEVVAHAAVIRATVPWIFREEQGFEEARDVITGIFEVYSR